MKRCVSAKHTGSHRCTCNVEWNLTFISLSLSHTSHFLYLSLSKNTITSKRKKNLFLISIESITPIKQKKSPKQETPINSFIHLNLPKILYTKITIQKNPPTPPTSSAKFLEQSASKRASEELILLIIFSHKPVFNYPDTSETGYF